MNTIPAQPHAPLRVAVIGSGPAGLFAADELLRRRPGTQIHVHEALPAPHGLVRYGVAPDHPHTRRVSKLLDSILARPGMHLHLNSHVGSRISVEELRKEHDALIFATGAARDRALGLPGDTLSGVWPSTRFAGWVNGHPLHCEATPPPAPHTVAILGHGNVALDVARLLARPAQQLRATDIAPAARDALAALDVRRILLVGRRGPAEAAFGHTELEEIAHLEGWHVSAEPFVLSDEQRAELLAADDRTRDVAALLERLSQAHPPAPDQRRIVLVFNHAPSALVGTDRVAALRLERTRLDGPPGQRRAVGLGEYADWPVDWVIQAVGHVGERIPGLPFDDARGIIPHEAGRVLEDGKPLRGIYAVGWIKRGAKGLIGLNRRDALDTVNSLLADFPA